MKTLVGLLIASLLIICVSCTTQLSTQQSRDSHTVYTKDLREAIAQATFVGYVIKRSPDMDVVTCVEVFKGEGGIRTSENAPNVPMDNQPYLLVVQKTDRQISYLLYPVKHIDDLSETELQTLQDLPCYDQALQERLRNGACTREYDPVCGCNNKTYGNECEARRNGIVKYRIGSCI